MANYRIFLKTSLFLFIGFCIPAFLYGITLILFDVFPFGDRTILISDLSNQYVDYYIYLYDVYTSDKSILYSWEAGLGLNFMGIFAYYLASPLSFIILLFDRANITEALVVLTAVKIGLAGLSMSYFLFKSYSSDKISSTIFGTMYALMGFSIVYSFNLMWLDGIYMLPVVLLGIEKLLHQNRYLLLIISLTITFTSNFYISYMVGLFAILYFLIRFISLDFARNSFIKRFLLFSMSTIVAAGMAAFVIVPVLYILKNNPGSVTEISSTEAFTVNFIDLYVRLFNNEYSSIIDGLPNIFSGVFTVILFPLFFFSNKINWKEKSLFGLLVLFLVMSFEIPYLDLMWHGFDKPNWFPYRYSFLLSFLLIYLSFRAYQNVNKKLILPLGFIYLINLYLIYNNSSNFMMNILLLSAFLLIVLIRACWNRKVVTILIGLLVCIDVVSNSFNMLNNLHTQLGYHSKEDYNKLNPDYERAIREIHSSDKSFYRLELDKYRTLNDPFRFDYKGITHFSTFANIGLNRYLNNLGYTTLANYFWVSNQGGSLVTRSLLGFKYYLSETDKDYYGFNLVTKIGDIRVYENEYALPIGYLISDEQNWNHANKNPFDLQNQILETNSLFTEITPENTTYENLKVSEENGFIRLVKLQKDKEAYVKYSFHFKDEQELYTFIKLSNRAHLEIELNGESFGRYPYTYNNEVIDLGSYQDESISVDVRIISNEAHISDTHFYTMDTAVYSSQLNGLRKNSLQVTNYTGNSILGEIDVEENDSTLLFSIPYDHGWEVKINNEKVEPFEVGEFLGVTLNKGGHVVELNYFPPGLKEGIIITSISFTMFIFIFIKQLKRRKN
jgi:uncharacterized membrane protein YfhO